MTREEAIHKMEYSKRAYQMLIDEKVQEGVLVGQGINGEWSADTPIIDAYKDMLEACEMAIKALEQEPKTGKWVHRNDDFNDWLECSECGYGSEGEVRFGEETNFCPHCGADMRGEA